MIVLAMKHALMDNVLALASVDLMLYVMLLIINLYANALLDIQAIQLLVAKVCFKCEIHHFQCAILNKNFYYLLLCVCVCVCVCARARACVCVCMCLCSI